VEDDSLRACRLTCFLFRASLLLCFALLAGKAPQLAAQSLTMDGESGVFFVPVAGMVPSQPHHFGGLTAGFHVVGLSPVFGNLWNVGIEEGYGGRLEFGYTRNNHTDGGDPNVSPLVNYAGMNIFNGKAMVLKGGYKRAKYFPAVSVGGVLRTNDPYIAKQVTGHTRTNGDIYGVATSLVPVAKSLLVLLNAGVRGTNAETHGYDGNSNFQARAFGAIGFPIVVKAKYLFIPAFEVSQEPHRIIDAPTTSWPSSLTYAVRFGPKDFKWSFDAGMGHVAGQVAPTVNLKANNGIAFAANYRF
jgi:hypothetical protein